MTSENHTAIQSTHHAYYTFHPRAGLLPAGPCMATSNINLIAVASVAAHFQCTSSFAALATHLVHSQHNQRA
eukprot:4425456-Amphidinium_carterae.1